MSLYKINIAIRCARAERVLTKEAKTFRLEACLALYSINVTFLLNLNTFYLKDKLHIGSTDLTHR